MIRKCLLIALIALAAGTAFAEGKTEIRLGYLTDLSGKGAFLGQQSRAGAELARQELRTSGYELDVFFEDHKTDPKTGLSAIQKLLTIDHVDAVVCDLTPPCIAAAPAALQSKKLFMYQAPITSILESNPYAFKNFLDYQTGCRDIASTLQGRGIKKIAHLKVNAEFGELCLRGAREILPDQEVIDYNSGDDLRSIILRLKAQGIEFAFQTGYEVDYLNRFRATKDLSYTLPAGLPEPLLTAQVLAEASSQINGTISFGFPQLSSAFVERLKRSGLYHGATAIESAAIAHQLVSAAALAISECGVRDVDCQVKFVGSQKYEQNLQFQGWKGRIASYPYALKEWKDGRPIPEDKSP